MQEFLSPRGGNTSGPIINGYGYLRIMPVVRRNHNSQLSWPVLKSLVQGPRPHDSCISISTDVNKITYQDDTVPLSPA